MFIAGGSAFCQNLTAMSHWLKEGKQISQVKIHLLVLFPWRDIGRRQSTSFYRSFLHLFRTTDLLLLQRRLEHLLSLQKSKHNLMIAPLHCSATVMTTTQSSRAINADKVNWLW